MRHNKELKLELGVSEMAFCKIVGGEGSGNHKAIDEAFGRYWVWFSAKFLHPSGMNRKHINNFCFILSKVHTELDL